MTGLRPRMQASPACTESVVRHGDCVLLVVGVDGSDSHLAEGRASALNLPAKASATIWRLRSR